MDGRGRDCGGLERSLMKPWDSQNKFLDSEFDYL
jgi:hypothetical protein